MSVRLAFSPSFSSSQQRKQMQEEATVAHLLAMRRPLKKPDRYSFFQSVKPGALTPATPAQPPPPLSLSLFLSPLSHLSLPSLSRSLAHSLSRETMFKRVNNAVAFLCGRGFSAPFNDWEIEENAECSPSKRVVLCDFFFRRGLVWLKKSRVVFSRPIQICSISLNNLATKCDSPQTQ